MRKHRNTNRNYTIASRATVLSVIVGCGCILKTYCEVAAEDLPHNDSIVPVIRVAKKNLQGSYSNLYLSDKFPLPSNRYFIGTTSYVRVSEEAFCTHLEHPELFLCEPSFDGKVLCNQTFANIEGKLDWHVIGLFYKKTISL